ncbi:SixA phosphatase family protein [Bifidobacterium xylocopae]|uniref:Phosphoglycerate mutase n=1 Tax=Bifidobacterium xylocopae TaxID=2493119 RepID=A0A366KDL3_9BIFI|nr:histidine phosphatase family protein [Bifidobacterium xylocopae]RBP99322.1 phosphoglycerate mutase [Bifidobacterium xylocopae]
MSEVGHGEGDGMPAGGHLLLIMRHAQAEPGVAGGDRMRPLSLQGRHQAEHVGRGLARHGWTPDRIVCSGATRTRQTLDQMLDSFGDGPRVDYREGLYSDGTQALLDELSASRSEDGILLVVAHEPTVSYCSRLLATTGSDGDGPGRLGLGMPPAAVACLISERPFSHWGLHSARLCGVFGWRDWR